MVPISNHHSIILNLGGWPDRKFVSRRVLTIIDKNGGRARWTKRNHRQSHKSGNKRDCRSNHKKKLINIFWDHLFFKKQFYAIANRLQNAIKCTIRTNTILHPSGNFSLNQNKVGYPAVQATKNCRNQNNRN